MKRKRTTRKCDAIRKALHEDVTQAKASGSCDYRPWLGLALKAPLNPKPLFRSEDQLWT
jgi:hypothetical protein